MAEAFLNSLYGNRYMASSAGTEPGKINPHVVTVMKEIGYDLSNNRTKSVDEFLGDRFDLVVTLCDQAQETCPFFPGARKYLHESFDDPSSCVGSEAEILACVRRIRNEIRDWVAQSFKAV